MSREQVSFRLLHHQLLELIKVQEEFANDPFITHYDDCGYSNSEVREPAFTHLAAITKAYLHAFEVHRLLFDTEYREAEIERL